LAFHIQIAERDEIFLFSCQDIPEEARDRILKLAWERLSTISDEERLNPQCRLERDPNCFIHHVLFLGDGRLRTLRFVLDDSSATAGVLRIVYVDILVGNPLQQFE
jgi:hypothetical protein